jgi:hypothetical protein
MKVIVIPISYSIQSDKSLYYIIKLKKSRLTIAQLNLLESLRFRNKEKSTIVYMNRAEVSDMP